MSRTETLKILRGIIHELRLANPNGRVQDTSMYAYVMDQFRRYQVTSEKLCRAQHEMIHLGKTYLCLLHSVRRQTELHEYYKGKGERSVEETAKLVGFRIPNQTGDKD